MTSHKQHGIRVTLWRHLQHIILLEINVSIDNSHSRHSAIAIEVTCENMKYIRNIEGDEGVQKAWKRVWVGYLLSLAPELPGTANYPSRYRWENLDPV